MTTRTREKWILLIVVVATFSSMVYFDSIVLADVLFVIGGVVLMVVPFDRKRDRTPWAKSLLAASALLLVLKGGVHLLILLSSLGAFPDYATRTSVHNGNHWRYHLGISACGGFFGRTNRSETFSA